MKISVEKEREHILCVLSYVLKTNIELMTFLKKGANDTKSKDICEKSIRQSKKGLRTINEIKHIEILRSLYNKIISGKEYYFAMTSAMCSYNSIKKWDTTEKGFKEFLKMEDEEMKLQQKKFEQEQKEKEFFENAEKQGKKVEMIYDNETKKLKPIIIEESENA